MKRNGKFIWDYDFSKMNFDDPEVMKWYLKRKIDFGDWNAIDAETLKIYLPELDIDPSVKKLLTRFLKNATIVKPNPKKFPKNVPTK